MRACDEKLYPVSAFQPLLNILYWGEALSEERFLHFGCLDRDSHLKLSCRSIPSACELPVYKIAVTASLRTGVLETAGAAVLSHLCLWWALGLSALLLRPFFRTAVPQCPGLHAERTTEEPFYSSRVLWRCEWLHSFLFLNPHPWSSPRSLLQSHAPCTSHTYLCWPNSLHLGNLRPGSHSRCCRFNCGLAQSPCLKFRVPFQRLPPSPCFRGFLCRLFFCMSGNVCFAWDGLCTFKTEQCCTAESWKQIPCLR